jgi:DNA polymerase V
LHKITKLANIAKTFSIMEAVELIGVASLHEYKTPVLILENYVAAGFPSPALDYMEKEIDLAEELIKHPLATFIMRTKGDSMKGAYIADGALLVVDKSIRPVSGKIVVAVVNGEFTVKRLIKTPRSWVLHAENPGYKPIRIAEDMQFEVGGAVTKNNNRCIADLSGERILIPEDLFKQFLNFFAVVGILKLRRNCRFCFPVAFALYFCFRPRKS